VRGKDIRTDAGPKDGGDVSAGPPDGRAASGNDQDDEPIHGVVRCGCCLFHGGRRGRRLWHVGHHGLEELSLPTGLF